MTIRRMSMAIAVTSLTLMMVAATLAAASAPMSAATRSAPQPLAFALTNPSDPQLVTLLDHAEVDGLALQTGWAQLETQDNVYSWTSLDQAFNLAQARNKRISLHVMASPRTPGWLAAAGASYYTGTDFHGNTITDVVPWDGVYLSKYSEFLQVLAQHVQTQGYTATLFDVSMVVPVSEMNLVACRNGLLGSSVVYSRSLYLSAWQQMVDAYQAAFPTVAKFVSPAVNDLICAPAADAAFYPDVMDYALNTYGNSFWMFAADLTAEGSQRTTHYLDYVALTSLGYQTIWSATDDPTHRMLGTYPDNLTAAVCQGLTNGATYFEIYAVDVLNAEPAIQAALQTIHDPARCTSPVRLYLPLID